MKEPTDGRIAGQAVASAIAWTSLGKYAGQALRWGSTLLVARLLHPSDYGLVGMTSLFTGLVSMLAEFGVGTAALKMRELDKRSLERLHGLAFASGFFSLVVGLAAAVPLARFFDQPLLSRVVTVSSVGFLFASLQTVPLALLQRDHRFKALAVLEFSNAVVLSMLVLLFAALGFGYWSLVVPPVIIGAVAAAWLARTVRLRLSLPRLNHIREAAVFSAWVFVSRIGGYFLFTVDFLVVGKVLGSTALGSYQFAWSLANIPNDQVNGLIARVSGAFYSKAQDNPAEIARLYQRLLELVSFLTIPLTLGLAAVAPEFVAWALGDQWQAAVVPLQILCVFNASRASTILATPVLQMTGEVRFLTIVTLCGLVYLPALFYALALKYGPTGVAFGWMVGYPPMLVAILLRVSSRVDIRLRTILHALLPAAVGSLAMLTAVYVARRYLPDSAGLTARFALLVVAGIVGYVMCLATLFRTSSLRILRPVSQLLLRNRGPVQL